MLKKLLKKLTQNPTLKQSGHVEATKKTEHTTRIKNRAGQCLKSTLQAFLSIKRLKPIRLELNRDVEAGKIISY